MEKRTCVNTSVVSSDSVLFMVQRPEMSSVVMGAGAAMLCSCCCGCGCGGGGVWWWWVFCRGRSFVRLVRLSFRCGSFRWCCVMRCDVELS